MTRHTSENYAAARVLHARAREYRGQFLNLIACIEHEIAHILTEYFCLADPMVRELFFDRIACRFSLEEKRTVLISMIKQEHPSFFKENSQYLNDIKELQSFRNKLAHSILDVSDEALARPIEDGVAFIQWKNGTPITESEFDNWCVRANMVLSTLNDTKTLLPFRENRNA